MSKATLASDTECFASAYNAYHTLHKKVHSQIVVAEQLLKERENIKSKSNSLVFSLKQQNGSSLKLFGSLIVGATINICVTFDLYINILIEKEQNSDIDQVG